MPLPPPPPGFQLDTPGAIGRPVIRKGVDPVKPDLPQGYGMTNGTAAPVTGLPREFTMPDKWERATPADLKPLGLSGPYLINRKTGDVKLLEQPKNDPAKKEDISSTINQIANVIDAASKARKLSKEGWFATGFGANLAKNVGGTSAADVDGLLSTITSNTAFDRLQKMRNESPTGGALGAISERELDLLGSTIASVKQGQGDEQFQENMQKIINAYGNTLLKIPGGRQELIRRGVNIVPQKGAPAQQPKQGGIKFLGFE